MPTLFDSLSKRLDAQAAEPPMFAPQQSTIASGLRAKSGKAPTSGAAPQASNVGEQSALDLATTTTQQAGQQSALAGAKVAEAAQTQQSKIDSAQNALTSQTRAAQTALAGKAQVQSETTAAAENAANQQTEFNEEQKITQINVTADQTLRSLAAERGMNVDNIFREFETSQKELDFRKDAAQLEQIGFNLAMRDKEYVAEINRVGAERDLHDQVNFKEEMQDLVFGSNLNSLMNEMGAKSKLNASQREWDMYIANIDPEIAARIAAATAEDEGRTAMIGAAGTLAKTGIDMYSSSGKGDYDQDYQNYKNDGGKLAYGQYQQQVPNGHVTGSDGEVKAVGQGSTVYDTADSSYGSAKA